MRQNCFLAAKLARLAASGGGGMVNKMIRLNSPESLARRLIHTAGTRLRPLHIGNLHVGVQQLPFAGDSYFESRIAFLNFVID
jgi:hypothetical protein